ncbi:MAG: hypothetical protein H0U35_13375 [Sporichthyaceae bacterium]|nr:hypothetical protein [Sporichthyaceae bacterium]
MKSASGWSVQVVGQPQHIEDPDEMSAVFDHIPDPWAPGLRPLVVRILASQVTGRRFERR